MIPEAAGTTFTPAGPGAASQLWTAIKDHRIGVHGQGEGNGTPAIQINGASPGGQSLTIEIGPDVPGGPPGSQDEDGDRYVEIWNLVFM